MEFLAAARYATANLGRYGDTDIFPLPPENHLFFDERDKVVELLGQLDRDLDGWLARFSPATSQQALSPAGYFGFRWASQLEPIWNAYLLSLVTACADEIEKVRLPPEVVPSHRVLLTDNDDRLFASDGYVNFVSSCRRLAEQYEFVIATDIADFYQRIYHHRLENALRDADRTSHFPDRIIRVIDAWSSTSYGLPVGGPAARLLSEVLLNRTDQLLRSRQIEFRRYADDYRIFARSRSEAFAALAYLSETLLRNEGLALSKPKTKIMTRVEFLGSFMDRDSPEEIVDDLQRESRAVRARELLGFSVRFDPYSPDAHLEYENLRAAVDRLDLVDLFSFELKKTRIDAGFTKKLLAALRFADPRSRGLIASSIADNFELLAPLFPQVMQTLRDVLRDAPEDVAGEVRQKVQSLFDAESYLLRAGVNLAYAVRVLAVDPYQSHDILFARLFDAVATPVFVQRDIVIAMSRWGHRYWISDKKNQFSTFHPWVQRSLLMASYDLGDEGKHWRNGVKNSLNPFDSLVRDWISTKRSNNPAWELPL